MAQSGRAGAGERHHGEEALRSYQSTGPHWTYGWLRRPELDNVTEGYCYEAPNGDLVFSRQEDHIEVMTLFELIDSDGGHYLVDRLGLSC